MPRRLRFGALSLTVVTLLASFAPRPAEADEGDWVANCGAGAVSATMPLTSGVGADHLMRVQVFPHGSKLRWGTASAVPCTIVRNQAHGTKPKVAEVRFFADITPSQVADVCANRSVTLLNPTLEIRSEGWEPADWTGGFVQLVSTGGELVVTYHYSAPNRDIAGSGTFSIESASCSPGEARWFGGMPFIDPSKPSLPPTLPELP